MVYLFIKPVNSNCGCSGKTILFHYHLITLSSCHLITFLLCHPYGVIAPTNPAALLSMMAKSEMSIRPSPLTSSGR